MQCFPWHFESLQETASSQWRALVLDRAWILQAKCGIQCAVTPISLSQMSSNSRNQIRKSINVIEWEQDSFFLWSIQIMWHARKLPWNLPLIWYLNNFSWFGHLPTQGCDAASSYVIYLSCYVICFLDFIKNYLARRFFMGMCWNSLEVLNIGLESS